MSAGSAREPAPGGRPAAAVAALPERALPERPVFQSLVRTPRYAGVDRSFLVLEVTLVVCLGYLMGPSWGTAAVVGLVVGVLHPLMARLSADDDLLPHLVVRTLAQADAYAPLPAAGAAARAPSASVPSV